MEHATSVLRLPTSLSARDRGQLKLSGTGQRSKNNPPYPIGFEAKWNSRNSLGPLLARRKTGQFMRALAFPSLLYQFHQFASKLCVSICNKAGCQWLE